LYTRYYGNRRSHFLSSPPQNYNGTSVKRHLEISAKNSPTAAESQTAKYEYQTDENYSRVPLTKKPEISPDTSDNFSPPFGDGNTDGLSIPADFDTVAINSDIVADKQKNLHLPKIKSDDILLLGLIFLLISNESESTANKEAAFILAILFISGMG